MKSEKYKAGERAREWEGKKRKELAASGPG